MWYGVEVRVGKIGNEAQLSPALAGSWIRGLGQAWQFPQILPWIQNYSVIQVQEYFVNINNAHVASI